MGEKLLLPFIEADADGFRVGARNPDSDYVGPVARVSFDDQWLHIITDDYEGAAMLNIEALPMLRRALARIAKQIDATLAKGEVDNG